MAPGTWPRANSAADRTSMMTGAVPAAILVASVSASTRSVIAFSSSLAFCLVLWLLAFFLFPSFLLFLPRSELFADPVHKQLDASAARTAVHVKALFFHEQLADVTQRAPPRAF